jgi:hypothetical protein
LPAVNTYRYEGITAYNSPDPEGTGEKVFGPARVRINASRRPSGNGMENILKKAVPEVPHINNCQAHSPYVVDTIFNILKTRSGSLWDPGAKISRII